jgi:hypothetical protein
VQRQQWYGNRRQGYRLALALLAAVTLAACGQLPGGAGGQDRPAPAELVRSVDCTASSLVVPQEEPSGNQVAKAGAVPEGFVPVEVIRCDAMMATVEDDEGLWSAVTEERLAGNLDALVEALAQPSDSPRANQVCTADMEIVPDLWLIDAQGQAMRAAWPTNSCGKTKPGVREILGGMEVVATARHKVELIQPRAALDAGCPAEWGIKPITGIALAPLPLESIDDVTDRGGDSVPGSPGLLPNADEADTLRLCQYGVDPATSDEDSIPDEAKPEVPFEVIKIVSGSFSKGGSLGGSGKDAILNAAAADPADTECAEEATEFAVLWPLLNGQSAGAPLTFELDGCQRLFGPDGAARTMPDEAGTAVVMALDE